MDETFDLEKIDSNYYKFLGVNSNSNERELRKAINAKALKYHPDKNDGDPKAAEAMKYLNQAREVLFDPEKKIRYDERLADKDPAGAVTEDLM